MNTFRRCLVASIATTVVTMGGVMPAAIAEEQLCCGESQQAESYTLTIHKRIGANENVQDYKGAELDTPPGTGAGAGFEFTITQVTPAEGKDRNDAAKATPVEGGYTATGATNSEGKITFAQLPAGVYRVHEKSVPDAKYVPGPDFLVAVPLADKDDRNKKINDVVVYPKNTEAGVTKEVEDADKHGGDEYKYTIKASIPAPATGNDKLVSYRVTDALDGRLEAPKVEDVTVELTPSGAVTLDASDYTVTVAAGTGGTAHNIEVKFSDAGLAKLEQARDAGQSVQLTIKAKAPADVEMIPNKSILYFNNGNGGGELKRESDEVKTYWGKLNIVKTDEAKNGLEGAEFQLVKCTKQGDKYVESGDKLTVNGKDTWTTDSEGKLLITGIHASDFANNEKINTEDWVQYCAQETKAPKGFLLDSTLIPFILTEEGTVSQRDGDTKGKYEYGINMVNHETSLPNTGGMGIGLLVVLGLVVIGGGAYAARRNSSKA